MELEWDEVVLRIRRARVEIGAAEVHSKQQLRHMTSGELKRAAVEIGHALVALDEDVQEEVFKDGV
jgi:hypothetical protein